MEPQNFFHHFWSYGYEGLAQNFFKKWYFSAIYSRLKPVIYAAKKLKWHIDNILAYVKHRISILFFIATD
jgi:transposase